MILNKACVELTLYLESFKELNEKLDDQCNWLLVGVVSIDGVVNVFGHLLQFVRVNEHISEVLDSLLVINGLLLFFIWLSILSN